MKKIFTLLAVAAMAFSANAELTYLQITPQTEEKEVDGETKTVAVNFPKDSVIFDCEAFTGKLLNDALNGGCEYEFNYALTTTDGELGSETVTPMFTGWFELRSKKPVAADPLSPETDGATRSALLIEVKKPATLYAFVRTGSGKNIQLFNDAAVEVARESQGWYTDPTSTSNAFFTAIWKDVPVGSYVLTETGGTGRLAGMAYELAGQTNLVEVAAEESAPVEYFNLQGVRVAEPANGLFIRKQGNKVTKVIL